MFEYIQSLYNTVFTAADLAAFMKAGWITSEQAAELEKGTP